jgi:hypothetical protein
MIERTLSERVERIEKSLCLDAFASATGSAQQYAGCDRVVWAGENSGVISTEAAEKQRHYERSEAAQGGANQARDRTSLEEILKQLTCLSEFGEMVVGRLEDMGDRVYGSMPQEASGAKASASAPPEALVDRLFLACNRLSVLMSRFESAQTRVCRIA